MTYRAHHEYRAVIRLQVARPKPIPDLSSYAGSQVHPQSMAIYGSMLSIKATLKPGSWIAEGRSLAHPHGSFTASCSSFWERNKLVELPQRRERTLSGSRLTLSRVPKTLVGHIQASRFGFSEVPPWAAAQGPRL